MPLMIYFFQKKEKKGTPGENEESTYQRKSKGHSIHVSSWRPLRIRFENEHADEAISIEGSSLNT